MEPQPAPAANAASSATAPRPPKPGPSRAAGTAATTPPAPRQRPTQSPACKQYKTYDENEVVVSYDENFDYSQSLNETFSEIMNSLDRQNVQNNLMEMQSRAANLTEESWINEYMRKVPGATKEIAKLAYEQTMDNLKK